MRLIALYLQNFRSFKEALFEFSPTQNLIVGPNAKGKTTILEAIHFLISGRSFRQGQTADLIKRGEHFFKIEATFEKHGVEQTLRIACDGKERRILYNNTPCPTVAGLIGLLQGVVATPDDSALVKGSPSDRRQFLDLQIAQADPLYVHHFSRYSRAMKQRNHLLKARQVAAISSWEREMARSAAYIVKRRYEQVDSLKAKLSEMHGRLSEAPADASLSYRSSASYSMEEQTIAQHYSQQHERLRKRELELGVTLSGPHKDDLQMLIGEQDVRFFASEGQQRGFVTVLRLAEWEALNSLAGEPPLLLMDDIGVSLDDARQKRLLKCLPSAGQVFITATKELGSSFQGKKMEV